MRLASNAHNAATLIPWNLSTCPGASLQFVACRHPSSFAWARGTDRGFEAVKDKLPGHTHFDNPAGKFVEPLRIGVPNADAERC
jgi:hypothetical protein